MMKLLRVAVMVAAFGPLAAAQTRTPVHLLDWIEPKSSGGSVMETLRTRLDSLTDFFVRVTSPDIARDARHLWIVSVDGRTKCLVSDQARVSEPRWGAGGFLLYLVEADTNADGRIDFRDSYLVRTIRPSGRDGRTLTQGESAVWAPDGRHVAILRNGSIAVATLDGEVTPLGAAAPQGKIVVANGRSAAAAREFWTVDARTQAADGLPTDLRAKYLWLGSVSPSGARLVFADATKTAIFLRPTAGGGPDVNLTNDRFANLDPTWSPAETHVAYVSDSPLREPRCSTLRW
jgi:hypothetical protein